MKKVIAMGEALIDFIPCQTGCAIKDVESFSGRVGGAPCNVATAVAKLGGKAMMITQLGNDAFGDKIIDEIGKAGVNTSAVSRSDKANTSLAFVSLKEFGNRDFSFYRKPGADMLFEAENLQEEWFNDGDIFHFCSVALVPSPMRDAHIKALEFAEKHDILVSFDPNLRFMLWENKQLLHDTVLDFMRYADFVKISDEELEFITGMTNINDAKEMLFSAFPKLGAILFSKGKDGAELYTRNTVVCAEKYSVKALDTTGAGDCITGAFLYKLASAGITSKSFASADSRFLKSSMDFANACSSLSVISHGAIDSYPSLEQVEKFMKENI